MFDIFISILFPYNYENLVKLIIKKLKKRYPKKAICLLPSARLGFYLSLKFLFKPNDELIFSSMSFPLYIKIANQLKLKVKLVDVSEKDLNIDANKIEAQITNQTKGIVVTHLFGNPCEINKIKNICKKKKIILIEDCAQSFNSKINNIDTGNFGDIGIISTSLLKTPTFLSGGILILKDYKLYKKINNWKKNNLQKNLLLKIKLFIKVILSILNSYPKIYSILSAKIFNFLINFNPRVYRKILYSGMGLKNKLFDPLERPVLSKYQLSIGLSQLNRCDEMNNLRRKYSIILQNKLKKNSKIKVINNHFKKDYNHQYFVILIKKNFKKIIAELFRLGIHVIEENVWDCTKYGFKIENINQNFPITKKFNSKLVRIQNNSFLNENQINKIAEKVLNATS